MNAEGLTKTKEAGKILVASVAHARSITKKGATLLDIATEVENFIITQGGKPAFPINLSINEIAAHATPTYNDGELAHGLLKVDIGVHIDGWAVDTAFSVDLEQSAENKQLITAAESGLAEALTLVKHGISTSDLGERIEQTIIALGATPVRNLTGHSIEQWNVHAGLSIPNYAHGVKNILGEGVFAIEPFTTFGAGMVRDGKPSGIYHLVKEGTIRDTFSRTVLEFIYTEYKELPFCSRWIHAQFGTRGLLSLRLLEQAGLLYQYPQLIEVSGKTVAQAEHTILITKKSVEVLTN